MDAHFVPPLTIGPVVVASLRPVTDRVFHGHLMVEAPESLFDDLAEAGLDIVSFHHEAVADPAPVIAKARGAGMRVGMTLNMETPVDADLPVPRRTGRRDAHEHPTRLVGTGAEPRGVSATGGRADARSTAADSPRDVELDGGVKIDNAQRAIDAGASVLVAASAIFQAPDPTAAARELAAIARGEVAA